MHRAVDRLDPAHPFDVGVALEAGQQHAHREALLGADRLAVLEERDHRVVVRLPHREAAAHGGGVRAFGDEPGRARIEPGFLQQHGELHARPFRAGEQAMQHARVHLLRLGRARDAARIAGALDIVDARLHRIAQQRVQIEHQRLAHHAVDHQLVLVGIDVGDAVVVALIMQAGGRDRALQHVERRARGAGTFAAGRRRARGEDAGDVGAPVRGCAIGRERRALLLHPGRRGGADGLGLRRGGAECRGRAGHGGAALQEERADAAGRCRLRARAHATVRCWSAASSSLPSCMCANSTGRLARNFCARHACGGGKRSLHANITSAGGDGTPYACTASASSSAWSSRRRSARNSTSRGGARRRHRPARSRR